MATQIKFGTSGWRALVAEEFTFENVRRAVHGISRYVAAQGSRSPKVIVGRDPRFLGETFVAMAAEILSGYQITPLVIAEAAPTPAISYAVTQAKADGAINFTASHNPPEYNGIKFSTPDGAPALPEATKAIEAEIAAYDRSLTGERPAATPAKAASQPIDPRRMYLSRLREIVDFDVIKKSGLKVVFDPLWGAARGYSDDLLRESGVEVVRSTTTVTCCLAVMPPNRTTICSKIYARKCGKLAPASVLPPTEMRTASASSTRMALLCSRITLSPCCSITWWKRGVGGMAWASR